MNLPSDLWFSEVSDLLAAHTISAHHDRITLAYNNVTAEPSITQLEGDCIHVCLTPDNCGYVSSFHLVEPKLNQLRSLALDHPSTSRQEPPYNP